MRICLTIDVEWAPEFVIEWMAEKVRASGVPATWFATHDSAVLKSLAADPSQEIGLHPNFLPGSTHGSTMEEVMRHLMRIYPGASGIRAHGLLDSTRHQRYYRELGFRYVSNIMLWGRPSEPFYTPWTGMRHIPLSWEDDVACGSVGKRSFEAAPGRADALWVLNFHPLYCYVNDTVGMPVYAGLKAQGTDIGKIDRRTLDPVRRQGDGLASTLSEVLAKKGAWEFATMRSICEGMTDRHQEKS